VRKRTPHEAGLLQDVCANPADDVPRLVYADWLEDNGDPQRAEFIRTHVEMAKLGEGHRRHASLFQRAQALLMRNASVWHGELPDWARPRGYGLGSYDRGFLREIHCTARQWLKGAKTLLRTVPVDHLSVSNATGKVGELCRHPGFERVRSLGFFERLTPGDVAELAAWSPAGSGLELRMHTTTLQDEGVLALAKLPFLPRLRSLCLSYNRIGEDGARAVAAAPLSSLEVLLLTSNRIGDAGVAALAASSFLPRLTRLDLSWVAIGRAGVRALAAAKSPLALASLDLSHNSIGDEGLAALAGSAALANLRHLRLADAGVGPAGVVALTGSPHLTRFESLDLLNNPLGDAAAVALAGWPGATSLRDVLLTRTGITAAGAVALAESPYLAGLHCLRLGNCQIGDGGALALARSPYLGGLRLLALGRECGIGEQGRKALKERFGARVSV
jgi:uncharacterized protein (TIGR02996 family)